MAQLSNPNYCMILNHRLNSCYSGTEINNFCWCAFSKCLRKLLTWSCAQPLLSPFTHGSLEERLLAHTSVICWRGPDAHCRSLWKYNTYTNCCVIGCTLFLRSARKTIDAIYQEAFPCRGRTVGAGAATGRVMNCAGQVGKEPGSAPLRQPWGDSPPLHSFSSHRGQQLLSTPLVQRSWGSSASSSPEGNTAHHSFPSFICVKTLNCLSSLRFHLKLGLSV